MGRDVYFIARSIDGETLPENFSFRVREKWNACELGSEGILVDISRDNSKSCKFVGIASNRGHQAKDVAEFAREFCRENFGQATFFVSASSDDEGDKIHFLCGPKDDFETRRRILHRRLEKNLDRIGGPSIFSYLFEMLRY